MRQQANCIELCGLNKKHKLGLKNPTPDTVAAWIDAAANTDTQQ